MSADATCPGDAAARGSSAIPGDMAAYARLKRQMVGDLTGTVLEIGAGKDANRSLLGAGVDWIGLEPDRRLRRRLNGSVVAAVAEQVPLRDASVDAVLSTIVLCSVDDQHKTLHEVLRVLRPGGRFVFFEHVASPPGTWHRRFQSAVAPFSRVLDRGCDPSRETWNALAQAGFSTLDLRWFAGRRQRFVAGCAVA